MKLCVFPGYSDIYGKKLSFDEFCNLFHNFSINFMLNILLKVDAIFFKDDFRDDDIQNFFQKSFFSPNLNNKIIDFRRRYLNSDTEAYVFSRQQIENLIRLSIYYSNENESISNQNSLHIVQDLFLLMNDYYDSITAQKSEVENVLEYLVRNYLYNSSPQIRKLICRYYDLFIDRPKKFIWYSKDNWDNIFISSTGITILELMSYGFSFLAYWNQISLNNIETINPFINKNTFYKDTVISSDKLNKAYEYFCTDIKDFKRNFKNLTNNSSNWQLDFEFQYKKPLIELTNGQIASFGSRFLITKITENIYWQILDNSQDKEVYLSHFGEVFESYAFDILKRIFRDKAKKIFYGKNRKEACDCLLIIRRNLFIFEIKSGRINKNVHLTGNIKELYEQYKSKLIIRQLKQISNVLNDYKKGYFNIGDLKYCDIKKIYPICISLTEIPQFKHTRNDIESEVKQSGIFFDDKICQFTIMDIEELEILEAMLTREYDRLYFMSLIKHKVSNNKYREGSFKNFLYDIHKLKIFSIESEIIEKNFAEISRELSMTIFNR